MSKTSKNSSILIRSAGESSLMRHATSSRTKEWTTLTIQRTARCASSSWTSWLSPRTISSPSKSKEWPVSRKFFANTAASRPTRTTSKKSKDSKKKTWSCSWLKSANAKHRKKLNKRRKMRRTHLRTKCEWHDGWATTTTRQKRSSKKRLTYWTKWKEKKSWQVSAFFRTKQWTNTTHSWLKRTRWTI